ncbi:MAG: sigma-70 family RNA polymerase sigma factor [Cyclobacteriaceae bacterium]
MQINEEPVCQEKVFQGIYNEHVAALRNFLFYKLGDLEKASDFAQEAFTKLWLNCSKIIFEKAKSYLFTTANRIFLDDIDHQKVILKFQRRADLSSGQMERNPEFIYRETEFKETLENLISNLPEKQRVAFLMSRIDKMSYQQISESLDVNIKTVEKHISGALKKLRSSLDEDVNFKL